MLARPFRTLGPALSWLIRAVLGASATASGEDGMGDRVVFRHYV